LLLLVLFLVKFVPRGEGAVDISAGIMVTAVE
jgi:hypothetical protein